MAAVGGVGASGTVHHPAGPLVALAIMSRWRDTELRETVRDTWLADLDPATAQYRFFVERARLLRGNVTLGADGSDGEFVALSATRGGRWFNNTEQVLEMFEWLLIFLKPAYIARLDMDGFLCARELVAELQQNALLRASETSHFLFFWGGYWCPQRRSASAFAWKWLRRADENFMVFSADLARLTVDGFRSGRFQAFFGAPSASHTFATRFGPVTTEVGGVVGLRVLDDPFRIAHAFNAARAHRGMPWPPWSEQPTQRDELRLPFDALARAHPLRGWDACSAGFVWLHPIKSTAMLRELDAARRRAGVRADGGAQHGAMGAKIRAAPCGYDFDSGEGPADGGPDATARGGHGARARGQTRRLRAAQAGSRDNQ